MTGGKTAPAVRLPPDIITAPVPPSDPSEPMSTDRFRVSGDDAVRMRQCLNMRICQRHPRLGRLLPVLHLEVPLLRYPCLVMGRLLLLHLLNFRLLGPGGGGGGGTQVTSTGQQVPARYRPTSRDRSDIREEYDLLTEDDKALSRTFHIRLRGTRLRQRRKES